MQIARLSLFDVNKKRLLFRAFPFRFRQSGESLRNPSGFLQRPSPAVIELHRIQKKLPQRMVMHETSESILGNDCPVTVALFLPLASPTATRREH
jgi:hypothetical protein